MKFVRAFIFATIALLLLGVVGIIALQTPWAKKKVLSMVLAFAKKEGITLSVDKVEGQLPFTWIFHNLHITTKSGDIIDVKNLKLRLAILPLLRGELRVTYSHIDNLSIHHSPVGLDISFSFCGNLHYKENTCSAKIENGQLHVGGATYQGIAAEMVAEKKDDLWEGSLQGTADFSLEGRGSFTFNPHHFFHLQDSTLTLPGAQIAGDVKLLLPDLKAQGGVVIQIPNLSRLSPLFPTTQLQGALGGKIDFHDFDLLFYLSATAFQWDSFITKRLTLEGQLTDIFSSPKGRASLEADASYLAQFFFDGFSFQTSWGKEGWPFAIYTSGRWKDPFRLNCSGKWNIGELHFDTVYGSLLQKTFSLKKPFSIRLSHQQLAVSEYLFDIDKGYFSGAFSLSPTLSKIDIKADHFPIDLFALATARFTLQGTSSFDMQLEGTEQNLQGRINLLLETADILPSGKKMPIRSKGAFQANIDNMALQIHSHLTASEEQFMEFFASLPITYQLYPLKFDLDRSRKVAAELTLEGKLEEIFDFVNIGSHRTGGLLSARLLFAKTLADPLLQGTFSLQNGSYENYFTGTLLKEIQIEATADKEGLHITRIDAKDDEDGFLSATGLFEIKERLPFSFDAYLENLKFLQLDWLSASLSGPLKIMGSTESGLAKGDLTVSKADIHIPDELPAGLPVLPVTYINQPPHQVVNLESLFPFFYATTFSAAKNIFLTGHGLNCELEGNLHVTGKNSSIDPSGTLHLLKGRLSFGGKEFTLTQGDLTFGNPAYLNFSGTLSLPSLTITAILRGPIEAPLLTFQSMPSLSTSSILSHILFNKEFSELSAPQMLQLADTVVTLSGGAGPNVLESIRKSLGIDSLHISTSGEDFDRVAVQISKYLADGILITLSQSAESSQVIVEVTLKGGFILQAETQENEQGKFSLKWNKNY